MKNPLMTSRTTVCAPKPTARPAIPAPVSTGVMFTPNSLRTISTAEPVIATVENLLTSDPSVRARLARSSASRVVPWLTSCSNRRTSSAVARTSA